MAIDDNRIMISGTLTPSVSQARELHELEEHLVYIEYETEGPSVHQRHRAQQALLF